MHVLTTNRKGNEPEIGNERMNCRWKVLRWQHVPKQPSYGNKGFTSGCAQHPSAVSWQKAFQQGNTTSWCTIIFYLKTRQLEIQQWAPTISLFIFIRRQWLISASLPVWGGMRRSERGSTPETASDKGCFIFNWGCLTSKWVFFMVTSGSLVTIESLNFWHSSTKRISLSSPIDRLDEIDDELGRWDIAGRRPTLWERFGATSTGHGRFTTSCLLSRAG